MAAGHRSAAYRGTPPGARAVADPAPQTTQMGQWLDRMRAGDAPRETS